MAHDMPSYDHMRIMGCMTYMYIPDPVNWAGITGILVFTEKIHPLKIVSLLQLVAQGDGLLEKKSPRILTRQSMAQRCLTYFAFCLKLHGTQLYVYCKTPML